MMRLVLIAAVLIASAPAAADIRAWNFRVLLDGRELGRHDFNLHSRGAERELRSRARFEVKVLFFNAYRYVHDATERWSGDCLRELDARTDDNGERSVVDWRAPEEGCAMSFAYWNPRILRAPRLLNAQTGEFVPVSVSERGRETIPVRGEPVEALRYRLSAPGMVIDLWYDGGRWVRLESEARGGRRLRYELL